MTTAYVTTVKAKFIRKPDAQPDMFFINFLSSSKNQVQSVNNPCKFYSQCEKTS